MRRVGNTECKKIQLAESLTSQIISYTVIKATFYIAVHYYVPTLISHFATRVGTLIVATIYLQLIQNRYMVRSFTVHQCSHQHCLQPVASDVEVVGYL